MSNEPSGATKASRTLTEGVPDGAPDRGGPTPVLNWYLVTACKHAGMGRCCHGRVTRRRQSPRPESFLVDEWLGIRTRDLDMGRAKGSGSGLPHLPSMHHHPHQPHAWRFGAELESRPVAVCIWFHEQATLDQGRPSAAAREAARLTLVIERERRQSPEPQSCPVLTGGRASSILTQPCDPSSSILTQPCDPSLLTTQGRSTWI
jgi:hypothetical protein